MKKRLSLLIAIIMTATVMYIPAGVYAEDGPTKVAEDLGEITYEEGPDGTGYINIEGRTVKLKEPVDADMASQKFRRYGSSAVNNDKYDPRGTVDVKVKNQESTGLCWAFSMTSAAERDYYKESNKYVELSPGHLGYFYFNRVNDPLGNTNGDRNNLTGSGYSWMDVGGNFFLASQALAGWTGFASESAAPFGNIDNGYSDSIAYKNSVILQNVEYLDELSEVKAAVVENGAVLVSYHAAINSEEDSRYYDGDTYGYYCGDSYQAPNHAVAIVGWDDNFSAYNFAETPYDDNGQPINGAWIIQNSWSEYDADGGYFYLSYADVTTCDYASLDVQAAGTYDYNYQYDGNAYPGEIYFYEGEKASNVYKVASIEDQVLEAVNFTTWDNAYVDYTVDIYTGLRNPADPLSGTRASTFDVYTDNYGIYTFRLDEYGQSAVYLKPGTYYSIVLTPKAEETSLGVEQADDFSSNVYDFDAALSKGQSFYYDVNDNMWYDCADGEFCMRIKGLVSVSEGSGAGDEGDDVVTEVKPTKIAVKGVKAASTISVPYGQKRTFDVEFTPQDTTDKNIKWTSSAPSVAEVDANGTLKTYALGTAKITATASNGIKTTFSVKVTVPDLKAPGSISANLYGHDDFIASWSAVPSATGYYVYYKKSSWKKWKSLGTTTATSKKVANLTDGAKYAFRVYPYVKISGKVYKDSSYKTSSYVYALKKIKKPSVKRASKYYTRVTWKNIYGESGYEIARSNKKSGSYTVVKTVSYKYKSTKIQTPRKTKFYYKVRAYKTVDGKKIYGPWSYVRSYKLK